MHAGPAAAATKIKILIRGFLQLGKGTLATALEKLLKCFPVSAFLSGKWERCKGGLYGNEEYETCRAENSPWMPIQTRGEFGNSNKGRAANKSPQTAVAPWTGSNLRMDMVPVFESHSEKMPETHAESASPIYFRK